MDSSDLSDEPAEKRAKMACPSLPASVSIQDFVTSREAEIRVVVDLLAGDKNKKMTVAQRELPFAMRRRAMSHNVKRYPKRLRTPALKNTVSMAKKPKRPSKKYRHRAFNKVKEFEKRQRKSLWLETHVWHAKRCRMEVMWGYKVAVRSNDKIYRSSYRAMKSRDSCVMVDLSYMVCMELSGPKGRLEAQLESVFLNLSVNDCKGKEVVYHLFSEDGRLISPVNLLRNCHEDDDSYWLWTHPTSHEQVLERLKRVLNLDEDKVPSTEPETDEESRGKLSKDRVKLKKLLSQPVFANPETGIEIRVLKDNLNRFRFIGGGCSSVFQRVLQPVASLGDCEWMLDAGGRDDKQPNGDVVRALEEKTAVSLVVRDPRVLLLPQTKKTPVIAKPEESRMSNADDDDAKRENWWPLWSRSVRHFVSSHKMPDHEINSARKAHHESYAKPEDFSLGPDEARVPVLLIPQQQQQQPKRSSRVSAKESAAHDATTADLVLPACWGMSFWIPFVFRCVKPVTLKELESHAFESSTLVFPKHFPDTEAGRVSAQVEQQRKKDVHFAHPPVHRPNYIKLGARWPFGPDYADVLHRCVPGISAESAEGFFVLRAEEKLCWLRDICQSQTRTPFDFWRDDEENRGDDVFQVKLGNGQLLQFARNSLVWVHLLCEFGGKPVDSAMICAPTKEDLDLQDFRNLCLKEPAHPDPHESTRRSLRAEHRRLLESQHRKRTRDRKGNPDAKIPCPKPEDHLDFAALMRDKEVLQVTDECENARLVIGLVEKGDSSLSWALGKGLGLCSVWSLLHVLRDQQQQQPVNGAAHDDDDDETKPIVVLVRNPSSLQYYVARLEIL